MTCHHDFTILPDGRGLDVMICTECGGAVLLLPRIPPSSGPLWTRYVLKPGDIPRTVLGLDLVRDIPPLYLLGAHGNPE